MASTDLAIVSRRQSAQERKRASMRARVVEYGSAVPFGFRRSHRDERRLVVDDERWPLVEAVSFGLQLAGSVPALQTSLSKAGVDVTTKTIYSVLRNPIYTTGVWRCRWHGEVVHEQQTELDRRIPRAIFIRNNEILGRAWSYRQR